MTQDAVVAPSAPPPAPRGKRSSVGDKVRFVLRGIGQTLITLGLIVLLFAVYEVWITNIFAHREQVFSTTCGVAAVTTVSAGAASGVADALAVAAPATLSSGISGTAVTGGLRLPATSFSRGSTRGHRCRCRQAFHSSPFGQVASEDCSGCTQSETWRA